MTYSCISFEFINTQRITQNQVLFMARIKISFELSVNYKQYYITWLFYIWFDLSFEFHPLLLMCTN